MGEQYCDYDIVLSSAGKVGLAVGFRSLELGLRILSVEKGADLSYRAA